MIGKTNAGGGLTKSVIIVTAPTGSTVTCKSGSVTRTAQEKSGVWTFPGLDNGTWTITATKSGQTATRSVSITRLTVNYVTVTYFAATINVTYPAGSNCTVKNGSTTLTAPDTSGTWACQVPNAGTWVVTITNGTKTKSMDAVISTDGQALALTIAYTLTLGSTFWDGDISSLSALYQEGNHKVANVFTKEKVDLTSYDSLTFQVTKNSGTLNMRLYVTNTTEIETSSGDKKPATPVANAYADKTSQGSIDISALSGSYYLLVHVDTDYGASVSASVSDVTLS